LNSDPEGRYLNFKATRYALACRVVFFMEIFAARLVKRLTRASEKPAPFKSADHFKRQRNALAAADAQGDNAAFKAIALHGMD
jgi:hypothetical protein